MLSDSIVFKWVLPRVATTGLDMHLALMLQADMIILHSSETGFFATTVEPDFSNPLFLKNLDQLEPKVASYGFVSLWFYPRYFELPISWTNFLFPWRFVTPLYSHSPT